MHHWTFFFDRQWNYFGNHSYKGLFSTKDSEQNLIDLKTPSIHGTIVNLALKRKVQWVLKIL